MSLLMATKHAPFVSATSRSRRLFLGHIQIFPRLHQPAGFEMGSGMSINSVLPEERRSSCVS
jgi:hypothetical protein